MAAALNARVRGTGAVQEAPPRPPGYNPSAMPRRLAAVLIVASLAFGALLAAGLVFLLRDSDDVNGALATMSARERPVTIAVPERIGAPNSPRLTGEVLLIGERAGFRFLRLPRDDGLIRHSP